MDRIILPINYEYGLLREKIDLLCKKYTFLRKKSIGKSVLGKDIYALSLGKEQDYSLYAAAFHGSEHITTNVIMMWLEDICISLSKNEPLGKIDIAKALSHKGIIIVPSVNPDGCDISISGAPACYEKAREIERMTMGNFETYNANFRGVDINHNFDAGWNELHIKERRAGILGPSPGRFGGTSPESEPETKALCDLCRRIYIRQAFALHSQGRVIYWSFGKRLPKRAGKIAELLSGESGYALDYPLPLADGGGFKDWFIERFDRPGFTIEIGKGKNPLPIESAREIYDEVKGMLTLSVIL